MRILICSSVFLPNPGGSGLVARLLAEELSGLGHEVIVHTRTQEVLKNATSYQIINRPTLFAALLDVWRTQIILLVGPLFVYGCLRMAMGRPAVMTHQMFPAPGWRGLRDRLFPFASTHVAPSQALMNAFPARWKWHLISNPYDDRLFFRGSSASRRDIAFVGRLVEEKGVDECIRGFASAKLPPDVCLKIFGGGSLLPALKALVNELGIASRVHFYGELQPNEIAKALREIRVQVISSRWQEPFGIVALEGLASGCEVIVSASGGLTEAVGRFGRVYKQGDIQGLADCISSAYAEPAEWDPALERHLSDHSSKNVAARYLAVLLKGAK